MTIVFLCAAGWFAPLWLGLRLARARRQHAEDAAKIAALRDRIACDRVEFARLTAFAREAHLDRCALLALVQGQTPAPVRDERTS